MDPTFAMAYRYLSRTYVYKGMYEEALETLEKWKEVGSIDELRINTPKMMCYAHMGRKKEAIQLFERTKSNLSDANKASYYFALGDIDQGFVFLEKAYAARNRSMRFIKVHPIYDKIRDDPRYKEILRKMNLD
jgi:tetratricopeptide (TPR) repeat protein